MGQRNGRFMAGVAVGRGASRKRFTVALDGARLTAHAAYRGWNEGGGSACAAGAALAPPARRAVHQSLMPLLLPELSCAAGACTPELVLVLVLV